MTLLKLVVTQRLRFGTEETVFCGRQEEKLETAIIYHYFEVNETYKNNFIFFLNTAIDRDANYFIFISSSCSIDLPNFSNVEYFFIENKNNDFGAVTEFHKLPKSHNFKNYIFINSSVRGPFLTTYYNKRWYEAFTSQLSEQVVLVGSSINLLPEGSFHSIEFGKRHNYKPPFIHVQTTAYALSSKGYKLLTKNNFYSQSTKLTKNEVISDYEILMSQILMRAGLTISSLLPTLKNFNSSRKYLDIKNTSKNGDVLFKSAFYGRSLSPIECLFVKTNRNMISENELCSYTFTSLLEKHETNELDANGVKLLNEVMNCAVSSVQKRENKPLKIILLLKRVFSKKKR